MALSAGSTAQPKAWLYGGMSLDSDSGAYTKSALLYQLSLDSEGLPVWTNVNLPKAPSSRFGANIEVVGPFVFQYSGRQPYARAGDARSGSNSDGDLQALCTFADELLLPKWIDLSNLEKQPLSRVHYASAVIGTSIWIHGGESNSENADQRRTFAEEQHELYLLATSPDALPSNVACPRGFKRSPPPLGPCIDIGRAFCVCMVWCGFVIGWFPRSEDVVCVCMCIHVCECTYIHTCTCTCTYA
jgi:hypothetical protein